MGLAVIVLAASGYSLLIQVFVSDYFCRTVQIGHVLSIKCIGILFAQDIAGAVDIGIQAGAICRTV